MQKLSLLFIALLISVQAFLVHASVLERADVRGFINEMSKKHGFKTGELDAIFSKVKFSDSVINAISRPAEALPWHKYRSIFLGADRVRLGVEFWRRHKQALQRAEAQFGVPAELLVAVIGVETRYGEQKGKYPVIDSLATLAFEYPQRSRFFRGELEQYLLLTKEQGFDPLALKGSYAGAMGIPQFISSSYRTYAVDFDHDGVIDIWNSLDDAIGSIGNYFKQNGWQRGEPVAMPAIVKGDKYKKLITDDLRPVTPAGELRRYDIEPVKPLPPGIKAKLLVLQDKDKNEYWLGFENFYVITRYNTSALYAMAVYQLAAEIKSRYRQRLD